MSQSIRVTKSTDCLLSIDFLIPLPVTNIIFTHLLPEAEIYEQIFVPRVLWSILPYYFAGHPRQGALFTG